MIISLTLGIVIAVVVGLAVGGLIFYLLWKIKAGQKAGVIVGLIVGMIAGVGIVMMAGRIVVVKSMEDAGEYLVYGSPEYEFSNGFKLDLDMGSNEGFIINDSEMEIVLEKIVYSDYAWEKDPADVLIKPMSITEMDAFKIDYYFDEQPPETVEVSNSQSSVTKYHLRTKESYEYDYGPYYYDSNVISVQVGNKPTAVEPNEEEED